MFNVQGGIESAPRRHFCASIIEKFILPRLSRTLAPDRAAIEFILDVERKRSPAAGKLKAESFFDATFIDERRKEGY